MPVAYHKQDIIRMAVFFGLMLLVYLAGNIYIYMRGVQTIHHFPLWTKWILSICFWMVPFSFIFIFLFRGANVPMFLSHTLFEIGTGWLIFTLYMVLLLGCFDLIRLISKSLAPYSFFLSVSFTICLLAAGYYRYQHPVIKIVNLVIGKQTVTNEATMKIVAISDVHLGHGTTKSKLQKYVEMINQQDPDVILICGDLIDNSIVPVRNQRMHEELSTLKSRYGIYMTPGNHEYISGMAECMEYLSQTSIQVLRDTVVMLPNGVQIVGREDRSVRTRKNMTELIQDIQPDLPVIVLDHQPVEIDRTVKAGADLLICGHTHNGQVWPLNLLIKKMFDISYGYEKREQTHIYVTSGLSLWGPPFRIGSQSEMVVFQLTMDN